MKTIKQYWEETKKFLFVNKEGALFGAIAGFIAFWFTKGTGATQMAAINSMGLIDVVVGKTVDIITIANVKLGLTYILIGALIGMVIDMVYKPKV